MKNLMKLKLHSSVDIITNSSTVIFTYSEGAVDEARELINEVLKLEGSDKSVDDLFWIGTFLEDDYYYRDEEDFPEDGDIGAIIEQVLKGEIEKPDWMKEAESKEDLYCYERSTSLYILPKDKKYNDLANKMLSFLYSTSHEATRDG